MGDFLLQEVAETFLAIDGFTGKPEELISLLQYFQTQSGYISEENVHQIALHLKVSEAQIYGVATFYSQFKFEKPGRNRIRVCRGSACHIHGGDQLSQKTRDLLGTQITWKTSKERVWAGGDIASGAAAVILAMGAGRKAAISINEYLVNPIPW